MKSGKIAGFLALLSGLLTGPVCATQEGKAGADLRLELVEAMAGKPGAAVVLDVSSGRVLAQSNLKIAAQRVTTPGSAVKPFVLMKLLQSGKLDPEQRLVCQRPLTIAGKRMDCTHPSAITDLDAADAIAYSCNSYFAQAATRLSPAELAETFERAGFASRTGLAGDEAVGNVVPAGDQPHLQLQALGYWGVEITPLELVAAYRNLALKRLEDDSRLTPVFIGLERSVQYGMAHTDGVQSMGIAAAGKTGTAAGHTPYTHGFFAGYAPAEKPQIVLVVYLEHGRGSDAAAVAALIFKAYAKASGGAPR